MKYTRVLGSVMAISCSFIVFIAYTEAQGTIVSTHLTPGSQVFGQANINGQMVTIYQPSNGQQGPFLAPVNNTPPRPRNDDDDGPEYVDPRTHERWRIIGDLNVYGSGYDYKNVPCTGAPGEDTSRCNNTCQVISGWSCDTRDHLDPVTLQIYVDGVLYDTFRPWIRSQGLTDNWWANLSRFNHTPNCGQSPGYLYDYRYPTPVAWKDGRTRTITIRGTVASTTINSHLYRNNNRLNRSHWGTLTTERLLNDFNISGNFTCTGGTCRRGDTIYALMYGPSSAPTSALMANAGWNDTIKSFAVNCPALPNPAIDLASSLPIVPDQIVNQPYTIRGTVQNLGTAPATGDVPVTLQFDYGRDGFTNGRNNDFAIDTTVSGLAVGAIVNQNFNNIRHTTTGAWRVRMLVDPASTVETDPTSRANNTTPWQNYYVTVSADTPILYLNVLSSTVKMGEDILLTWFGQHIRPGTCRASGAWLGIKSESGFQVIPATNLGSFTFTLNCTGTDGTPLTDTENVLVIGDYPDYQASLVLQRTCTTPVDGSCDRTVLTGQLHNIGNDTPAGVTVPYRLMARQRAVGSLAWSAWGPVANGTVQPILAGRSSGSFSLDQNKLTVGEHQFRLIANPDNVTALGEQTRNNNESPIVSITINQIVPPECSDGHDNDDSEDDYADALDPACWYPDGSHNPGGLSESLVQPPTLTITANPRIVRYNGTATITYSIRGVNPTSCTLTGPGMPTAPIVYPSSPSTITDELAGTHTSNPLQSTQTFTITCGATRAQTTVEVIPLAQEV